MFVCATLIDGADGISTSYAFAGLIHHFDTSTAEKTLRGIPRLVRRDVVLLPSMMFVASLLAKFLNPSASYQSTNPKI